MYQSGIKNSFVGICVALLFFVALAPRTSAETYYYPVSYNQNNTAYLQALINQLNTLLAQLQMMQLGNQNSNYHKYYFNDGTLKKNNSTYKNFYSHEYDIDVSTEDADTSDSDTVTLLGEIDLSDAPYADVWFEYGTDSDLDEETDSERVTDDETFEIEVDNINEDDQYYFRAVAEDPSGFRAYGSIKGFEVNGNNNNTNDGDTPNATTDDAEDVDDNGAELHGDIDMNDYENGIAFFVYGEDESSVEDVEDESEYADIDEDGDNLQKILLSSNLDDDRTFWSMVSGLDNDTDYFFRICVEYDDADDDQTLVCGDVENFTTDN